jgi:hypothetical protein
MAHDMAHDHGHKMHRDGDQDEAHHERDEKTPVTFNQFETVNYLRADINADGSGVEHFILQVKDVAQNGVHVSLPGLGTDFGMYFIIDATLAPSNGAPIFSKLNIALRIDPANNDGTPSATQSGASFANGTVGDYTLATGSLVSAGLALNAIPEPGTRHANFVEQLTPTKPGFEVFGSSLTAGDQLQELLTTLPSNFNSIPVAGGGNIQLVNGGTGLAQLTSQKSFSLSVGELTDGHDRSWSCPGNG